MLLNHFKPGVMFFHRRLLVRASLFLNFCVLTYVALQAAQSGSNNSDDNFSLQSGVQIVYSAHEMDSIAATGAGQTQSALPLPTDSEMASETSTMPVETNSAADVLRAGIDPASAGKVDLKIPCHDINSTFSYTQRGSFWIMNHYVQGERKIRCNESITYTTHGDVTFLDNIVPLSERWDGPLSVAVYTPGTDYDIALNSIAYLRQCTGPSIQDRVSFHLVLDERHFPKNIRKLHSEQGSATQSTSTTSVPTSTPAMAEPKADQKRFVQVRTANGKAVVRIQRSVAAKEKTPTTSSSTQEPAIDNVGLPVMNCSLPAPWTNPPKQTYKQMKNLTYPVNVLRNVARQNAPTHYILASDAELYPSPNLVQEFFDMLRRNDTVLHLNRPKVFVLPIFEVYSNQTVPTSKSELVGKLKSGLAVPFHQKVCSYCHSVPKSKEWLEANITDGLHVFHIAKRHKPYQRWEPIYIGTQNDPLYDERLTWEGKSDKMTQGYALCILDYDFMILDNAFLVHRPGVKIPRKEPIRDAMATKQSSIIRSAIYRELKIMYGYNSDCIL